MIVGGIEAGGTKMVCAIANETGELLERITIPTGNPKETMRPILDFFRSYPIESLGVGCFGPVDLDPNSCTYGFITTTPKLAWRNFNIVGKLKQGLKVPVGFDTDVNGAVLGEVTYGCAKGCQTAIYITIGTGVGVGAYINGKLLHGLVHPDAGHIYIKRHEKDTFQGNCPVHGDCLEGLASGPAIKARWGEEGAKLAGRCEVWEMEAYYIAQAVMNYILCYSPEKIILWGGVMHHQELFSFVQTKVVELLNDYVWHESIRKDVEQYIVRPALLEDPGILGAIELGKMALKMEQK